MIFCKSEHGFLFGAYVSKIPNKPGNVADKSAFLFSVSNKAMLPLLKEKENTQVIKFSKDIIMQFGSLDNKFNSDLYLSDGRDDKNFCISNLGHIFKLPDGFEIESEETINYLGGVDQFNIEAIEVFLAMDE